MLKVLFSGTEIGASAEEIASRTGDHPLLTIAERTTANARAQLPEKLFYESERVELKLMHRWNSL